MAFDFNKIKKLFVVSEEGTQPQKSENNTVQNNAFNTNSGASNSKTTPDQKNSIASTNDIDNKILDSLMKALSDNNQPGEDYLEYWDALKAMENIPLEENIKIQTVLATLSTKGLTVDKIIESSNYYLGILGEEQNKFNKAMENQIEKNINAKKKDISAIDELIKLKSTQIANLTKEITESQDEIEKLKKSIGMSEVKISETQNCFNNTHLFVTNQIIEQIQKIQNVIKK